MYIPIPNATDACPIISGNVPIRYRPPKTGCPKYEFKENIPPSNTDVPAARICGQLPKNPSTVAIINASQTEYPVFAAAAPVSTIIPDPTIFPTVSQTNADVPKISFSFFPISLSLSLR